MPEDTFSEKESFGCQPGREKGLWNAEIHQTAGIDTGIRNIHRAVAERGLQKSCLLMFGTDIAHWHSIGILASCIGEQECHQVYKEKKKSLLARQPTSINTRFWELGWTSASPHSPPCSPVLWWCPWVLEGNSLNSNPTFAALAPGSWANHLLSFSLSCLTYRIGIITLELSQRIIVWIK